MKPQRFTFPLVLLSMLVISPSSNAEDMPPMDSAYMHNMMLKMNQMQSCLSAIQPEAFHQAEQVMTQAQAEITQLCQQQKRDVAQQKAIQFSKLMQQSTTLQEIEKCSMPMQGLMPSMPLMSQASEVLSKQNICDILSQNTPY